MQDEDNILGYFYYFGEMFQLLRDILIPFARLTIYLTKQYSYSITADLAQKIKMSEFVNKKDDRHLKNLYKEVREKALNKRKGLAALYDKYQTNMQFNLECDQVNGVVEKISGPNATLKSFLLNSGTTEDVFMTTLLDCLVTQQNRTLELFEKYLENHIDIRQVLVDDIKKILGRGIDQTKVTLDQISEEDIIFVDDDVMKVLKGNSYFQTAYNKEDEFNVDKAQISKILAHQVLAGKKKIMLPSQTLHLLGF